MAEREGAENEATVQTVIASLEEYLAVVDGQRLAPFELYTVCERTESGVLIATGNGKVANLFRDPGTFELNSSQIEFVRTWDLAKVDVQDQVLVSVDQHGRAKYWALLSDYERAERSLDQDVAVE